MQASSLMNRLLGTAPRLVLAGVLGTFAGTAWAADQPALQAIDVQPLPGQQLQITLRLSGPAPQPLRSEEHTSELQSRRDLVCRLLLEKKKPSRAPWRCCPPGSGRAASRRRGPGAPPWHL